jgi:nanoRNase/pAp phosphatase (c-di-AMP/oligoRNAs hydrolase)
MLDQIAYTVRTRSSQSPLLVFPADWNGDAVASTLALFLFLKKLGKNPEIAAEATPRSRPWSFLPNFNEIKESITGLRQFIISVDTSHVAIEKIKYNLGEKKLDFIISPKTGWFGPQDITTSGSAFKYDLIVAIGAADKESLGHIYENNVEFFYQTNLINIDCQADNEEFGQINLININAAANAETLTDLFQETHSELFDEDIATCLLTGIISGTKNFRTLNLTPHTLQLTSKLIALGGRREEITDHLYRSRDFKTLKLWGKVLANLKSAAAGSLVWSTIKRNDFVEAGASEDNLLDIIDELIINIPEAKLITLLFEDPQSQKNFAWLYSIKNINSLEMLEGYQPQGNAKVARATLTGDFNSASQKYRETLETKLKNLAKR